MERSDTVFMVLVSTSACPSFLCRILHESDDVTNGILLTRNYLIRVVRLTVTQLRTNYRCRRIVTQKTSQLYRVGKVSSQVKQSIIFFIEIARASMTPTTTTIIFLLKAYLLLSPSRAFNVFGSPSLASRQKTQPIQSVLNNVQSLSKANLPPRTQETLPTPPSNQNFSLRSPQVPNVPDKINPFTPMHGTVSLRQH